VSGSFRVQGVTAAYAERVTPALSDLTVDIAAGSVFAIIGPNGSGKSTLVRLLLGALTASAGTVSYDHKPIAEWPRRDFAQRVGAVSQVEELAFPILVRELVAMGRYPHLGALRGETAIDRHAIARAMERCNVEHLADRPISSLSGGERQRARIARALAQQPTTLVLDEPTVALDIAHEMAVFELLRSLTRGEGWTVIVATHHINLAARYADTLLLLDQGRCVATGTPKEVIRKESLEKTYGWPLLVYEHDGSAFDRGAPQIAPLSRTHGEIK
jgi:iron complex transport system ATP-binding protein